MGHPSQRIRVPGRLALACAALCAASHAVPAFEVEREDPRTGFSFEIGRIQKGKYENARIDGQMIQRTGVFLGQALTVEKRLRLDMAIGGLFWYATPETRDFHRHFPKFGPGVDHAEGRLALGDPEEPRAELAFGLLRLKTDPDAKNLGEYLFRSGAYPNVLVTGGWNIVNSAEAQIQGAVLDARLGPTRHRLVLSLERGVEPLYDGTPAWIGDWAPSEAFSLGVGAACAHCLPVKPSRVSPDGLDGTDPLGQPLSRYAGDTVVTDTAQKGYSHYTFRAVKLSARASFSPQALFPVRGLGPDDLRLYAEAAVLGVRDYPFYYGDIRARIPVMVGFNLPAFGLLDAFSVEAEYHRAEFENSTRVSYEYSSLPLPELPVVRRPDGSTSYADAVRAYDKGALRREAWKWSVYARRAVGKGLRVSAQAASDHFRGIDYQGYPVSRPQTRTPSDWYCVARLEWGI